MLQFTDIENARARIHKHIYLSPCAYSETISRLTGNRVFFKLDNLQMTGSFKERGALNRLMTLTPDEVRRGVIAASAGNHGLAVAFHSQRLNVAATIVMPLHAPLIKVSHVRRNGAQTLLYGEDYDAAFAEAYRMAKEKGLTFIHAFDDLWVIAGQGTMGIELYEQNAELDAVIVPVGGGGLIAGVALALKTLNPKILIIGVQTETLPTLKVALAEGHPVQLPPATTLADGIAVRSVGQIPLEIIRQYIDDVVSVSEREIANAVLLLLEIEKTVAEGAAAVSLAALVNSKIALSQKKVGLIVSGGNIDVNLISRIIEQGLIQDGRLTRLSVVLPDRPGSLAQLTRCIGDLSANILQISQRRGFGPVAISETEVELILETTGADHIDRILEALHAEHFKVKKDA